MLHKQSHKRKVGTTRLRSSRAKAKDGEPFVAAFYGQLLAFSPFCEQQSWTLDKSARGLIGASVSSTKHQRNDS